MPPLTLICAILTALKHKCKMSVGMKRLKQRTGNFCWMRYGLLSSIYATEFQTTEAYSCSDLCRVKCNMYLDCRDDKDKVTLLVNYKVRNIEDHCIV
jgi:hypothetical protein